MGPAAGNRCQHRESLSAGVIEPAAEEIQSVEAAGSSIRLEIRSAAVVGSLGVVERESQLAAVLCRRLVGIPVGTEGYNLFA